MALELAGLARAAKLALIDSVGVMSRAEFYLTNLETSEELQLCMTPESIRVRTGASFRSYSIVERGEVKLPKGEKLTEISWSGIFPHAGILLYPGITHSAWQDPQEIVKDLERWKESGDKIHLLVTQTPINLEMYLKDFSWLIEKLGDYKYEISLVAAKDLQVLTIAEADARRSEQSELKPRPRQKSDIGRRVEEIDEIWSATKILLGNGSLSDVERLLGANGTDLSNFEERVLIWN